MKNNKIELFQILDSLTNEHANLDKMISDKHTLLDQVTIQRLKRKKLIIRDKIEFIKSKLHPDIIA